MSPFENFPDTGLALTPPMHFHHLTGGLALLVGSNRLAMLLSPGGAELSLFSIPHGSSILSTFEKHCDLRVLGRNNIDHASELHDPIMSHFITSIQGSNRACAANTQRDHWEGLATALSRLGRGYDARLASRLASQIHLSLSRIERLSISYRTTLSYVVRSNSPSETSFNSDKYSHYISCEFRSCLNELYSLRDAALAAMFRIKFGDTGSFKLGKLKALVLSSDSDSAHLVSQSMFNTSGDLLIDEMSLYRNVAQHCLGATNPAFCDAYRLQISRGPFGELPHILFPLYDNMDAMRSVERSSSKGSLWTLSQNETERFMGLSQYRDALEFCFDCLARLLRIVEAMAVEIQIAPEMVTITDDDIIEATITRNGKTEKYRRDEKTGKLALVS